MPIAKWIAAPKLQNIGALFPSDNAIAKAILASWNATDGAFKIPGYGTKPEDLDPSTWGKRDGWILSSFAVWWNGSGKLPLLPAGSFPMDGILWTDLTQAHLDALEAWASAKGVNVIPGQPPSQPVEPKVFPKTAAELCAQACPPGNPFCLSICALAPASWPATVPFPPPKPDWWPPGQSFPPFGPWQQSAPPGWGTSIPYPPPIPGSQPGFPYPFQWPASWPLPLPGAPAPDLRAPFRAGANPGMPPSCDPGFVWDETAKVCQPTARPPPPKAPPTEEAEGSGVLWAVGGLLVLGVIVAVASGGGGAAAAAPTKERRAG